MMHHFWRAARRLRRNLQRRSRRSMASAAPRRADVRRCEVEATTNPRGLQHKRHGSKDLRAAGVQAWKCRNHVAVDGTA